MRVPPDHAVHDGRLAGLGMAVAGANRVRFDVLGIIHLHKFLIDKALGRLRHGPRHTQIWDEFATLVTNLSEQLASTTSSRRRKVDDDIVVLATDRLLDEWLFDEGAVDRQGVVVVKQLDLARRNGHGSGRVKIGRFEVNAACILDVLDDVGGEHLGPTIPAYHDAVWG